MACYADSFTFLSQAKPVVIFRVILQLSLSSSCGRPPLWSSGQSSWLQIRRPGFDSRHYQKKNSSGSGTGSTQEELLDRKAAAPV
jgi:hypothetical protein